MTELQSQVKCADLLPLSVRESRILEVLLLFVHHVDNECETCVEVVVQDTTILHDRTSNCMEEVPHALASFRLVVNELTKAGETLISRLSEVVI